MNSEVKNNFWKSRSRSKSLAIPVQTFASKVPARRAYGTVEAKVLPMSKLTLSDGLPESTIIALATFCARIA